MKQNFSLEIENEIARLKSLGWQYPSQIKLADFDIEREKTISFPAEAYDPKGENDDANSVWSITRAKKIAEYLDRLNLSHMWEIGAGNGTVAIPLRDMGIAVVAVEPLSTGVSSLKTNGFHVYQSTLEELNLPSKSIKALGLFDVREHIENPKQILSEVARVLAPNGVLLLTVPAHQWLFSDFDLSIGHYRRYSKRKLRKLLIESGFSIKKMEFLFGFLVLPAFLLRKIPSVLGRKRNFVNVKATTESQRKTISILRPIFEQVVRIESKLYLPFGLSLFSVSTFSQISGSSQEN